MPGRSSGIKQEPAPDNEKDMMEEEAHQDPAPSGPLKRARYDEDDEDEDSEEGKKEESEDEGEEDDSEGNYSWVKRIHMTNFMCHNKKTVELRKEMNFIGGDNGSGKSAVLVALAIGLGATGKDAKRADSLKLYIGPFGNTAKTAITISLHQDDIPGEKLKRMGGEVTIERTITDGSRGGAGGFRILDSKKALRSTKKDDVKRILDHISLQVNNPIQVMQQTDSKTFLHSGKPTDYYQFFHRATGLMDLSNEISNIRTTNEDFQNEVDAYRSAMEGFQKEKYEPAKKDYEETTKMRQMQDDIHLLNRTGFWAMLHESEVALNELVEDADGLRSKIEERSGDVQKEKEREQELKAHLIDLQKKLKEQQESNKDLTAAPKAAKEAYVQASKAVTKSETAKKSLEGDIHQEKKMIKKLEADAIEVERARAQKSGRQVSCLREVKADLARVVRESEEQRGEETRIQMELERRQHAKKEIMWDSQNAQEEYKRAKAQVQMYGTEASNNLNRFGQGVAALADTVKRNATKFRGKEPVGPLGLYIKLKDDKWKHALADTVDLQICQTYICHSKTEVAILEQTMNSMGGGRKAGYVALANYDTFDTKIYGEERTLMDVVEITHDDPTMRRVIMNVLIDKKRINEIRLADDYQTANKKCNASTPTRSITLENNVKHDLMKDLYFSNVPGQPAARKIISKKNTVISSAIRTDKDFFTLDMRGAQEDAGRKLSLCEKALEVAKNKEQAADREVKATTQELLAVKKAVKGLDTQRESLERKQKEEEEKEEEQEDEDGDPCAAINKEIRDRESEISGIQAKISEQNMETERLKEIRDQTHLELQRADAEAERVVQNLKQFQQGFQTHTMELEKIQAKIKGFEGKLHDRQRALAEKEAEVVAKRKEIAEFEELSSNFGEKVESQLTSSQIEQEKVKLQRLLATKQRESRKDVDKVTKAWLHADLDMKKRRTLMEKYDKLCVRLRNDYKKKRKGYHNRRRRVANVVDMSFKQILSVNSFTGGLMFDHKPEKGDPTMDPQVNTRGEDISEQPTQKKQKGGSGPPRAQNKSGVKELSGGERSFTTMCMTLALSEQSMGPLLALDEFDVFMDEKNRALCFNVLTQNMRARKECQLLVISPLSMLSIGTAPDIHRITMPKIDRSQRAIQLSAENE